MKKRIRNILLVFTGLALGLLISELTLWGLDLPRFYRPHKQAGQFVRHTAPDGRAYYLNVPSRSIEFFYDGNPRGYFDKGNTITHTTNSLGFRGPEFDFAEGEGGLRTVFLGDSITFGEGVKFQDTFPEKWKVRMAENCPELKGKCVAFNLGVGGYNISDSVFLFQQLLRAAQFEAVVLEFHPNDVEAPLLEHDPEGSGFRLRPRNMDVPEFEADPRPPEFFPFQLRTARFLWLALAKRDRTRKTIAYYKGLYTDENPLLKSNLKKMEELFRLCHQEGIHCFVTVFPVLYKTRGDYPFRDIHQALAGNIRSFKSPYVHVMDLLPHLEGKKATDLWVHPTDQHPNEIVHEIAARALAKETAGVFCKWSTGTD